MNAPQAIITLSPDGGLQIEQSINGTRRLVPLTQSNAGQRILRMLLAQQKQIESGAAAGRKKARANYQPNWTLIAKHPQVEIRQLLARPGVDGGKAKVNLEEMGL